VGDIEGIVAKAVKAAVQVVREEFQKCLDGIKKDYDDLKSFCSFLETCIQSLENPHNSSTAKEIAELSAEADALSSENRHLTIAVNDLDQQGQRHNIRIQGLLVKPGDNIFLHKAKERQSHKNYRMELTHQLLQPLLDSYADPACESMNHTLYDQICVPMAFTTQERVFRELHLF